MERSKNQSMQNPTGGIEHEIKGKAEIQITQQVRKKYNNDRRMNEGDN